MNYDRTRKLNALALSFGLHLKIPTVDGETSSTKYYTQFQRITNAKLSWSKREKQLAHDLLEIISDEKQTDYENFKKFWNYHWAKHIQDILDKL